MKIFVIVLINKILILESQGTLFQAPIQGQSSSLVFFLLILKKALTRQRLNLILAKGTVLRSLPCT